jgi:hypothetical protein
MNITLKNNLIENALELREEVFHFYISLIFVLKEGTSAKSSIQYGLSRKTIYGRLKDHLGHDKTFRTFQRNYSKLIKLNLITEGVHKTNYVDILHRSEKFCPIKKNFWTDIDSDLLKHLLFEHSGNELKVILKDRILGEDKAKSIKEKSKRYLKKVYKISNQKTLCCIQTDTFGTLEVKSPIPPLERDIKTKEVLCDAQGPTLLEPINTLVFNNINTSAKEKKASPSIDFKKLKMNLKSINTINKIRKGRRLETLNRVQVQESINQFTYAIDNNLVKVSDPTKFLAYNFQHYGIYVLQDQYISDYQYFKNTGEKRSSSTQSVAVATFCQNDVSDTEEKFEYTFKLPAQTPSKSISVGEMAYKEFLKLRLSSVEILKRHRRLVSKTPIFEGFESKSEDLKIKSNYYQYLLQEKSF